MGEAETSVRLSIKIQSGDVVLAQVIPSWAYCLFFNNFPLLLRLSASLRDVIKM